MLEVYQRWCLSQNWLLASIPRSYELFPLLFPLFYSCFAVVGQATWLVCSMFFCSHLPISEDWLLSPSHFPWQLDGFLGGQWREDSPAPQHRPGWGRREASFWKWADQPRALGLLLSVLKFRCTHHFCPQATNPSFKILKLKMSEPYS